MAPGTNTVMKLFRGSTNPGQSRVATKVPRLSRRSSGLAELAKLLNSEASLCVLDLGYTSPSNIRYFTERGHKIYSEDLLVASTDPRRESRRGPSGSAQTVMNTNFRLQRVFNNRHIENLFRDFASIKFFLARDNVREVLVVR